MTRPLFEDLLARSLAQLPEMETRILADEVVRLRDELATARDLPWSLIQRLNHVSVIALLQSRGAQVVESNGKPGGLVRLSLNGVVAYIPTDASQSGYHDSLAAVVEWASQVGPAHPEGLPGQLRDLVMGKDELATAREVIQESLEARRVTEEEGGSLNQANNEIDRLLALVAELESEVNLLHRQRHAAQEDAANARLLAEVRQLSQGEIDRLRARVAELEEQPRANELHALRNLFAAAGRTIHAASAGGRATLEEINDAWAEVCAAHVANRDLPAPDVVRDSTVTR